MTREVLDYWGYAWDSASWGHYLQSRAGVLCGGRKSLAYTHVQTLENALGVQKSAKEPGGRIGFETRRSRPYVVLGFADRTCDALPRTFKTELCTKRPRVQ